MLIKNTKILIYVYHYIDNQFYNNPKTKMTILVLGHGQTDRPTNQHLNLIFHLFGLIAACSL